MVRGESIKLKISKVLPENIQTLKTNQKQFEIFLKTNDNFLNKLVHSLAGVDTETFYDLKQEASLALWQSLYDFDQNRGAKFITFAYTKIRNHILYMIEKKQKHDNELVSIEKFKKSDAGENSSDYYESAFDVGHFEFDDNIINKVDSEKAFQQLNDLDKKILYLKKNSDKITRKQIAEKLGMNFHTFKFYYYGEFVNKMQKIFGNEFETSFGEREKRRAPYIAARGAKRIARSRSITKYRKERKKVNKNGN